MSDQKSTKNSPAFEEQLVNKIAIAAITEQRRARRWNIFFKLFLITYLIAFSSIYFIDNWENIPTNVGMQGNKHTALIDISGVISAESPANADAVVSGLRAAFEDKNTAGIVLRINSPGGSPVQAGYINDEIHRLRKIHSDIPFYSVITDICASGGYYIAVAGDKIYVNKASLVGSIGVILSSFGFVDTFEKLGIERRLLHAGTNKGFLDPFLPLQSEEVKHAETLLENIHQQFITVVKEGRKGKLTTDEEQLFSGLIWTGEQSIQLGLADGFGSAGYVAREIIGEEEIINFTKQDTLLDQFAERIGTTLAQTIKTILQKLEVK